MWQFLANQRIKTRLGFVAFAMFVAVFVWSPIIDRLAKLLIRSK